MFSDDRGFILLAVLLAAGAVVVVLGAAVEADAATIHVPDDYTVIQDAVDNANEGDTIRIRPGTYDQSFEVDKAISVIGQSKDTTIINSDAPITVLVTSDDVLISRMRFRLATTHAGLYIEHCRNVTVRDVICRNNNVGIWVQGGGGHTFERVTCYLNDNEGIFLNGTDDNVYIDGFCGYNTIGAKVTGGDNNTFDRTVIRFNSNSGYAFISEHTVLMDNIMVRDCRIYGNGGDAGLGASGIRGDNVDNLWVLNCSIYDNEGQGIIIKPYFTHTSRVHIKDTNSSSNKYHGISLQLVNYVYIEDCILMDSRLSGGIYIWRAYGESLIANCTIKNNLGIGTFESGLTTRHNKNQLIYNCTITDHPMYGISVLRDSSPQPAINVSIVDCVLDLNAEVGIAFSAGPHEDFLIKNCTISHSQQGIARVELGHSWVSEIKRLTVRDCQIENCLNGTVFLETTVSNSTFEGCLITECNYGLFLADLRDSQVMNCSLIRNSGTGASLVLRGSEVWNNNISSNWFGGVYIRFEAHGDEASRFHNNTIARNKFAMSGYGLYVMGYGPGTVEHNLFSNNYKEIVVSTGAGRDFFHNIFSNSTLGLVNSGSNPGDPPRFYLNSFINNHEDVDFNMVFKFDNGELGNYWDDYTSKYPDANPVGLVWDTPYRVKHSVFDNYPLVGIPDGVAPIAMAGDDQRVPSGTEVAFDGTLSTDDVGIVNHTWSFGYDSVMQELYDAQPSFTFVTPGTYTVTLTVRDQWLNEASDTMEVEVYDDEPPVADAGEDLEVGMGETFTLDGRGSADNIAIASYRWTLDPGGLDREFDTMTTETSIDAPGEYTAVLNVTDTSGLWTTDTVTIVVLDTEAPVADAGEDLEVGQGETFTLDGSGSADNVGIVSWVWTAVYDDETHILSEEESFEMMSTEPDAYVFTLNVTDAAGNWDADEVVVTVLDTTDPQAFAGEDVTVVEGNEVDFDGSFSSDNMGIVLYTWTFVYEGKTETLDGVEASFTFDIVGEYEVTLRVTDAADNWAADMMKVTVKTSGEDTTPPVADAGEDLEVAVGERATFDGGGSTDDVGIVSYVWTFSYDGMTQTLEGDRARFTFEIAGDYTVTLTVADGAGNEDTDTLRVQVLSEGERSWRLGPFEDGDGEPVIDVKVVVYLNEQRYETSTDDDGMAVFTITIEDLVPPASVKATKDGWKTLEFEVTLDANGDPEGDDIPVMEVAPKKEGEGSGAWMYVLAVVAVAAILVVVILFFRQSL